ncbi:XdhC family protein [Paenibacillus azoreducens]|uniref:Xanthine dehydrogenase subunit A n=1 Tax=Paenibacillus azoreducens TaxID=116718 RepID=A0A919YGW3_9BACL|nr:XdhC family protein [Paenibacillus azoreducens]GIO50416.1 putative xanthine dehydrogenase subunit A [Paenibacillus azoreducens]
MEDIHRILEAMERNDQRSVLATIIHVNGSAYRKEGASMLFFEDGSQIGMLSTGCLEADLAERVPEILETGESRIYEFDMQSSDPLSWGEATGCGGIVHVAMEPVNDVFGTHLRKLKECLDRQHEVILIKKINPDRSVSGYGFLTDDRYLFGEWKGDVPEEDLSAMAASGGMGKSGMKALSSLEEEIFLHTYAPKPRLIIFGAGRDARPLASFAAATGFSVTVTDWRPLLCARSYFPDAEALILGFPEETAGMFHITASDFVVVMTHNLRRDRQLIRILSELPLGYLGILGSKRRTELLFDGRAIPQFVHSPVGMPIGADGPEEIAVSILAEVIQRYRTQRKSRCSL